MADKMKVTLRLKAKKASGEPFFDGPLNYWLTQEQFYQFEVALMDLLKNMGLQSLEKDAKAEPEAKEEGKFAR